MPWTGDEKKNANAARVEAIGAVDLLRSVAVSIWTVLGGDGLVWSLHPRALWYSQNAAT